MGRKKKENSNKEYKEEIDLIPIEETSGSGEDTQEPENIDPDGNANAELTADAASAENMESADETAQPEASAAETENTDSDESAQPEAPAEEESESSALFGVYVAEENKWERKNRIKDEKIKAKQEKKRAKYADVDDDTYEQMKAGGAHKFFGVLSLMMLVAGVAAVALFVYKLVIAPSYAQVGEKEKNLHVEGFATETDTSKYEQQSAVLQGIATPSDLTDTWVAQPFEQATPSDVSTQDMDGVETLPADESEAKPVVTEE